jgi:predicted NACHT family NTPase
VYFFRINLEMQHLHSIPEFDQISVDRFIKNVANNQLSPCHLQEFLLALTSIDQEKERLVAFVKTGNDLSIINEIWQHTYDNSNNKMDVLEGHPFCALCSYFARVLQNGFPEKYFKKNDAYWFGDYYLPYAPHLLFAAGVASIVASKFF